MRINKKAVGIAGAMIAVAGLSGSGTAVAAGLITTNQIKDSAITTAKVKNGTLTLKDFKASERGKLVGPAGPAGPAGVTGMTGPAGASASASQAIVQGPTVTVAAYSIGYADAYCAAGKKITGGGYFASIAIPASSGPAAPSPTTGWRTVINNSDNPVAVDVYAFAVCA
ncbi:hypothetical protein EUA06_21535 [Nocardioides glacieisoli]|uniref:Collagen-like protein n=1 Tax=Nocardioides glacieisoli TaxID=1168730 RepID=A0A4Q2RL86_9ACTN|nr:hypothetical protein [Nocardioides glacieisoli]RYB88339.1 hypothetical protein EUA06_21535 [Nocardioides glacieisoli]